MRSINKIIIHCTATPFGRNVSVDQIRDLHVRVNGWRDIGYHFVIYHDGSVHRGRPLEQVGAHCKGHNNHSIGIAYVGGLNKAGLPEDTRTPEQHAALLSLVAELRRRFPAASVHGHNEFANKACPCFNVSKSDLARL